MNTVTSFIFAVTLLIFLVMSILLRPLVRGPRASAGGKRRQVIRDIFRDQLRELEFERSNGLLSSADFEQAKRELQQRLLDDMDSPTAESARSGGRKTAFAVLMSIPLLATAGYLYLGYPQALAPENTQEPMSVQQIDVLLVKLAERLKTDPQDTKGWVMLARSYKALGRFAEAAEAYAHGGALMDADPALLADYAESLAQTNGGSFQGKPTVLLNRALKIDPEAPQALFLAGAAASGRKDFAAVAKYWDRLLGQLEPDSEEARSLAAAVSKARTLAAQGKAPSSDSSR